MAKLLAEWQAVNDHLNNIVSHFKKLLPKQITVKTHGGRFGQVDIKNTAVAAPTLRVSLLKIGNVKANTLALPGEGASDKKNIQLQLTLGISVLAKDIPGSKRHQLVNTLAQYLAITIPQQTFGTQFAAGAEAIDARNLYDADLDKSNGVAIWAVAFKQQLEFPVAKEPQPIPESLLWAEVPQIGSAHKGNYQALEQTGE